MFCSFDNLPFKKLPITSHMSLSTHSTRELIISIIAFHPNLSCIQIKKMVSKLKSKNISSQAIFLILLKMVDEKILIKNQRYYSLNPVWIEETKSFFEKIPANYEQNDLVLLI
ncbi:MAG: hypothetical protein PHQ98_04620 [Candidatus ainarchaeum sp.]|nr:hypothetical protein [Candidatus ainarchaeum sp.]